MHPTDNWQQAILEDSDQCVLCGMCVPQCPTYQIYQRESESPRGRISLIQAYARGELEANQALLEHLNHCLGCMACQSICPSKVPYGRLIDQAKQQLYQQAPPPGRIRKLLKSNLSASGMHRYQTLLSSYKQSGLAWLLNQASAWLPANTRSALALAQLAQTGQLAPCYPGNTPTKGQVALFTGCMGNIFDIQTLTSSICLLNHFGYDVHVPEQQVCCGALHQHNGQLKNAQTLANTNDELFSGLNVEALIYSSNGCGSQLQQKLKLTPSFDILDFLLTHTDIQSSHFKSLDARVIIHESCSSQNILKKSGLSQQLLSLIPELELNAIENGSVCCGAGGSHQLQFPELSQQLLAPKLQQLADQRPNYLVSDNLGCSLHFQAGLKRQHLSIEVLHPASLLALCLK
ncbi:MAG: (Fe-S)-binding protein [Gammaproteobacteria bacterium]|nr:(Fe-S)-binding protein [Gammaproteobacteria bacterium]